VLWGLEHHLLPEAWLNGLLFIYAGTLRRPSFLMGSYSDTGWWYYYPLVMLFKTPLATLGAIVLSAALLSLRRSTGVSPVSEPPGTGGTPVLHEHRAWLLLCVALPPLLYGLMAITTPAAAGLRHVLPIYPFLFIMVGLAAARVWSSRLARMAIVVIAIVLAAETLSAFPDYIAFFNRAAGGERGGIRLLSDSNLDWGQDLPLLAEWQRAHPDLKLYLCYFGTADPAHYGVRYVNLPGGYALGPQPQTPDEPGVIAISATDLQGVHSADIRRYYDRLRQAEPREVLGGTIYLFDWPPVRRRP
jgi:hypothetical protein